MPIPLLATDARLLFVSASKFLLSMRRGIAFLVEWCSSMRLLLPPSDERNGRASRCWARRQKASPDGDDRERKGREERSGHSRRLEGTVDARLTGAGGLDVKM
mmetsp:Transcript_4648/g.16914  ORF Transcript_4648/g.16914 Transcript_4648/m.16914 type:complete len:103 (+) Transcript_4648:1766-2074(+)